MSAGKTANIGLNQWILDDPFSMEEMNEDNRRIDSAFAPLALVKLGSVTTSKAAQQVDLDLSGINFEDYYEIKIYWQLKHNETNTNSRSVTAFITLNNCKDESRYCKIPYSIGSIKDYPTNGNSSTLFQIGIDDLTKKNFPRYCLSVHPEDGCAFSSIGSSLFAAPAVERSIFKTSVSDFTPMPISALQSINFMCFNYPNYASILTGSQFEIYGVKK